MRLAHVLIMISMSLIPLTVSCQSKQSFKLKTGANFGYFKDELFSPMNYNKTGWLTELSYSPEMSNENKIIEISFKFGKGKLNYAPVDYFSTKYWNAAIQVDYLINVWKPDSKSSVFVGGRYCSSGQRVYWNGQYTAYSYLVNHGVGINVLYKFKKTRHSLSSNISIPLISYTTRPPDNLNDDSRLSHETSNSDYLFDGRITFMNKFVNLAWENNYYYSLRNCFGILKIIC